MLEWLKTILGGAYTEDIDEAVSAEIGKAFVSRSDFNEKNEALKTAEKTIADRDSQLEELKSSEGTIGDLRRQIGELQAQNTADKQNYEARLASVRLSNAVEQALTASGARNNIAVKALLADFLKDAKAEDDGTVKGLSDKLSEMAKAEDTSFLFNSSAGGVSFKGMTPADPGGNTPQIRGKEPKDMSYDELCAYLEANPEAQL